MRRMLLTTLLASVTLTGVNSYAGEFKVLTEEYAPFNFTESGQITGVSTEVVEAVLKESGLQYSIRSYPWARSYKLAQTKPDTLIYSISRNESREKLFKWIGVIVPSKLSLMALKSRDDVNVTSYDDIKKYKTATNRLDITETHLVEKGLDAETFIRMRGDNLNERMYKMLKSGRIDLWPVSNATAFHTVKQLGDNPSETLKVALELEEISNDGFYIAASQAVPDEIVEKLRTALEDFKKTDAYQAILKKWGL